MILKYGLSQTRFLTAFFAFSLLLLKTNQQFSPSFPCLTFSSVRFWSGGGTYAPLFPSLDPPFSRGEKERERKKAAMRQRASNQPPLPFLAALPFSRPGVFPSPFYLMNTKFSSDQTKQGERRRRKGEHGGGRRRCTMNFCHPRSRKEREKKVFRNSF